jgi:hypothetical protein
LATAISKSSCVTCTLLSLKANIPASVHTAYIKAPKIEHQPGLATFEINNVLL